ncbi:pilin [Amycolatopsis sacchari]|nr:pilin [Amycolatopsis sacchari]
MVAELVLATLVVTSSTAFADPAQVLALAADVNTVLTNIRNWLMGILALIATVFLTIGGVRYLMASGDPGEVQKAKDAFKNAGIGYGLAALAPVVVTILQQLVGA